MNRIHGLFALFAAGLLLPPAAHAGEDPERFLDVDRWHGVVRLRVEETFSGHREWNNGENYYDEEFESAATWRYQTRTGEGMLVAVDRFAGEESDAETGGMDGLPGGMDMAALQQAMQRSGLDPAMAAMAMSQVQNIQGGFGNYMEWSQTTLPMSVGMIAETPSEATDMEEKGIGYDKVLTFRLESRYRYHEEGPDTAGDWCVDDVRETRTANIAGNAGMSLVVNVPKQAYSFTWKPLEEPGHRMSQTVSKSYSCNPDGNEDVTEQRSISIVAPLRDAPDEAATKVVLEPLPASGMTLSGSRTIVVERPRDRLQDDNVTPRKVTLQWIFVPADRPLPELHTAEGGKE